MKHHDHAIGWKRANCHDVPLWKDLVALAACHAIVIGLVCLAVGSIHNKW